MDLVEGELAIRDAAEPYALTNPTSITGTYEATTGVISGGSFDTPEVRIEQEITTPIPATVFIDAAFTLVTPNSLIGTVDFEGNVVIQTSLRVDLHVDVQEPGGGTSIVIDDCVASPVNLKLEGRYDSETQRVTLVDGFSVPPVIEDPENCDLTSGAIDEQLAGAGHSLSMTMEGPITLPPRPGCETAVSLAASPEREAVWRSSVNLTATVSIPNPTQDECVEAATNGQTTEGGLVDFFDGDTLVGTAEVQADGTAMLPTTALTAGNRQLTARFNQLTPFNESTGPALAYRVTPNPAVTSTLTELHQVGATVPTEFTVDVRNTGFGRDIENARLDVTFNRTLGNLDLKPSRVILEYLDATETWVPVTLTPQTTGTINRVLWGSIGAATGFPLDMGEGVAQRLRIRFPSTGGPIATTVCTTTQETCPGPIDVHFELIEVNATGAPAPVIAPAATGVLGSSFGGINLIEAARRASTITMGSTSVPPISPQTVRQGGTLTLDTIAIGPTVGSVRPTGYLTVLLDGVLIPARGVGDGGIGELKDRFPLLLDSANTSIMFDLPQNASLGSHSVIVRYSGDERFLPQQNVLTFTVVSPVGSLYHCTSEGFVSGSFRAFVEGQANVPSSRPAGSEVNLTNFGLTMKFARERQGGNQVRGQIVPNNTTKTVGENGLAIDLGFGPDGSGAGASLTRTFGVAMTLATSIVGPGDPDHTVVDETIVINNPSGSVVLNGEPGAVVPVTLDVIEISAFAISGGLLVPFECVPVDRPLEFGRVTLSGNTLSVEPGGSVREGDEVSLTSTVAPFTSGQVEFRDGAETIGVSSVEEGVAVTSTDTLPTGIRSLTAVYTGGLLMPPLVSNTVELDVIAIDCPPLEEGSGAVVRLAYMELLGRCPDEAGYAFWKARLDGGTTPQAFASTISASDEAVGRVVNDAYQTMLGRDAEPAGKAFWVDRLQVGGRYDTLLADLASSPEFSALAGGTDEGFVERVYDRLLGRPADPGGLAFWTGRLDDAGVSPRVLVITFANLDEPLGRLVDAAYDGLLGRAPTTGERTDGIEHLRSTGDRSGLYAQLIGLTEFGQRAQEFPNT